jgi:citrate lyase beta subunit
MAEAAIPIVALIVLVGLSFYLFGDEGAKGPNQVALVNEVFTPTEKELDYYRRVIVAFDEAVARGSAATTIDGGTMIDYAMAETARRVLAWGESAKRGGQDVG